MGSTMFETTMPKMGENGGKMSGETAGKTDGTLVGSEGGAGHSAVGGISAGADGQEFMDAKARFHVEHPNLAMLGLYLGAFLGMLSETSMNIALPDLMGTFHVSTGVVQWMVVGYMLVIGIVLPFAGLLMKWFKAKSILIVALCAFFVGALVSGFAPSSAFAVVLVGRMIQGISTGLVLPMMFSVITEIFPLAKIGAAMGTASLVIMFAPAIGPTLAGALIGTLSWRAIFFFFAIIAAVAIVCAFVWGVSPYKQTKPKIDALSCLTSVLGFGGLVLGVSLISVLGFAPPVIVVLAVGVLSIVWYSYRQLHMSNPVIDLRALGIRQFTAGAIIVMMNFGITLASMYLMPQELQKGMGVAVAMTGLVMLPGGVVNAIVSLLAGRLYDSIGPKWLIRVGLLLSMVGLVLLMMAKPSSSMAFIIAAHVILMIGVPMAMSPAQSSALASLPEHLSTDGSTILNTLQQVLGAVVTAIATILLAAGQNSYAGGASEPMAFVTGSRWGFIFALVLAVVAFVVSFAIRGKDGVKSGH
ncbi:lincomycin resistance protein LmrB [Bifidobacterium bombi DSM 19703]|uniref:Lincomycin resistance protein LmrB n=2 Tax=Bifidobacterium bombi TaxID=471511 RepID=A0A086BP62_9BIFI|nr:lincomycin resistance protein LmrB [Bifidobacterium bombi DSM 19703]